MDLVKYHAFQISHYLERIAELAGDDEAIVREALKAHFETLANMIPLITKNIPRLEQKSLKPLSKELVHISAPLEDKLKAEADQLIHT